MDVAYVRHSLYGFALILEYHSVALHRLSSHVFTTYAYAMHYIRMNQFESLFNLYNLEDNWYLRMKFWLCNKVIYSHFYSVFGFLHLPFISF